MQTRNQVPDEGPCRHLKPVGFGETPECESTELAAVAT